MMMQLVEQGRVGLDDLVQKYLPYFTPRGTNGGADVTVRYVCVCRPLLLSIVVFSHLLTHYAGLPHTIPKQGEHVYESLEALVRKSANMRQLTPAGHTHKVFIVCNQLQLIR